VTWFGVLVVLAVGMGMLFAGSSGTRYVRFRAAIRDSRSTVPPKASTRWVMVALGIGLIALAVLAAVQSP
jgi:uncharacterized membrane protein YidH (DUF202 family)